MESGAYNVCHTSSGELHYWCTGVRSTVHGTVLLAPCSPGVQEHCMHVLIDSVDTRSEENDMRVNAADLLIIYVFRVPDSARSTNVTTKAFTQGVWCMVRHGKNSCAPAATCLPA